MPPLPPAGAVLKCQLKHTVGGDIDVIPHFYLGYTGTAPSASALNTFTNTMVTAWGTNLKTLAGTNVTLTAAIATDLSAATGAQGTTSAATVGTRTGGPNPASTCLLQNILIARRYRGGKPRIYWPYGTQTDISTGQAWAAGLLSAFVTGWNAFQAALAAAPPAGTAITGLVNVSYFKGFTVITNPVTGRARNKATPRATPVVDAVFNYSMNPIPASQRRRLRFG